MTITIEQARQIAGIPTTPTAPDTGLDALLAQILRGGGSRVAASPRREDDGLPPPTAPGGGGGTAPGETPSGFGPEYGKNPSLSLPPGWTVNAGNGALIPPGGGEVQGADDMIMPGEFFEMNGALYQWNGRSITEASATEEKYFTPNGTTRAGVRGTSGGFAGSSGGGGGFDTGPGYLDIANRRFSRDVFENDRDYARAVLEADRLFNESVIGADRGELGNRAGMGLSLAGILKSLMDDERSLYADPANFPELAAAYAGREGDAPIALTKLLGEGFRVSAPQVEARRSALDDVLNSLREYARPMNTDTGAVRNAYANNPQAEQGFRNMQAFEDARRMADGGTIYTGTQLAPNSPTPRGVSSFPRTGGMSAVPTRSSGGLAGLRAGFGDELMRVAARYERPMATGPVSINDLATQKPLAIAGEPGAGVERITVEPDDVTLGREYTPSTATGEALLRILRPLGFAPRAVLSELEAGRLPGPNMLPDAFLRRLKPSVRSLVQTLLLSGLGGAGLEDFEFERQSFDPQAGTSGVGRFYR